MLEDDKVAEVYLERPERRSIAGNIYLGIVDNVLPGMEAAFVEIGLEKNGFLYVDEIVGPELEGRKGARKIQDLIQRGEKILVQAVKDPMKTKGARLTTEISLPGRFVVYVPHGEGLGVSRRLEDDERNRLKAILKDIAPKKGGVIVRTAAEGASAEDVERDLDFLQRLWKSIEAKAKDSKAPALVYQEAELPLRVVRDLFTGDFERLLVDHDRTHKRIVGYLKKTSPHMAERVTRYKEREPLMEAFGVEQEIRSTLSRRVDLPSGGYLIFDYAEAFTVIDVNTGRFVGSRSKKSGGRLEDTITKNNLEAVKEVVRQLRLRDIGGIIVIDFIDMASPKNRAAVEKALGEELERDRTKTYVVEISPLGLVEMTRQNVTDGPREVMTKKCPTCGGDGIVVSEHTAAVDVERRLRGARHAGLALEGVPGRGQREGRLARRRLRRRAAARARGDDEAAVLPRRQGGRASRPLQGARPGHAREARAEGAGGRRPGRRGEARRGRAARSARGRREDRRRRRRRRRRREARRQEGDRARHRAGRRPRLGRAADTGRGRRRAAHRRRRGGAADARRRRARAPKKKAEAESRGRRGGRGVEDESDRGRRVRGRRAVEEGDEPRPPAKKRTRRGSRGGRNRKKKTATAAGTAAPRRGGGEPEPSRREADEVSDADGSDDSGAAAPAPVIHLPDRELTDEDGEAPTAGEEADAPRLARRPEPPQEDGHRARPRPRRGAPRPRRVGADEARARGARPRQPAAEPSENGDWGYTPMSQWGMDDDAA